MQFGFLFSNGKGNFMVINICVCVEQRPSSANLTHSAKNLLTVVVVAITSPVHFRLESN